MLNITASASDRLVFTIALHITTYDASIEAAASSFFCSPLENVLSSARSGAFAVDAWPTASVPRKAADPRFASTRLDLDGDALSRPDASAERPMRSSLG